MARVERRELAAGMVAAGVAVSLSVVAAAGGSAGALAAAAAGLLLTILRAPFFGIVALALGSPLLAVHFHPPGGSTQLYWPELVTPLLVPGILVCLLGRSVRVRAAEWSCIALVVAAAISFVAHGRGLDGAYATGIFAVVAVAYLAPALRQLSPARATWFLTGLWVVGLFEACLVAGSFVTSGAPLGRYAAHIGTLSHGFLASFLIVTVAVGAARLDDPAPARRWMAAAALALVGFALVVVSSRAGCAGALVAFATTALLARPGALGLVAGGAALVVLGTLVASLDLVPWLEHVLYLSTGPHVEETLTRFDLAREAWTLFLGNPVLGVGPGVFAASTAFVDYRGLPIASVHNNYLQIAAEIGVVGLAAFALVLLLGARDAVRLARRSTLAADRRLGAAAAGAWVGVAVECLGGDFLIPQLSNDGLAGTRSAVVVWALLGVAASRRRAADDLDEGGES
jgi:O-antigen ligase